MDHQCTELPKNIEISYVAYQNHGEWIAFEACTDGENLVNIKFCPYCGQQLNKEESL